MAGESKIIVNLAILGVLLVALLVVSVRFGLASCGTIPGFCRIYYMIMGSPKILIIYEDLEDTVRFQDYVQYNETAYPLAPTTESEAGEEGIGDAEVLRDMIVRLEGMYPTMIDVDDIVSAGMLSDYELIIVEGPKRISTDTLRALANYIEGGGKIIWVGDAGTLPDPSKGDTICKNVKYRVECSLILPESYEGEAPPSPPSQEKIKTICKSALTPEGALEAIKNDFNESEIEQEVNNAFSNYYYQFTNSSGLMETVVVNMDCTVNILNENELAYANPWIRGPQERLGSVEGSQMFAFGQLLGSEYIATSKTGTIHIPPTAVEHPVVRGYPMEMNLLANLGHAINISIVYPYSGPRSIEGYSIPKVDLVQELATVRLQDLPVDQEYFGNYGTSFPAIYTTKITSKLLYLAFAPEELGSDNMIHNLIAYMLY